MNIRSRLIPVSEGQRGACQRLSYKPIRQSVAQCVQTLQEQRRTDPAETIVNPASSAGANAFKEVVDELRLVQPRQVEGEILFNFPPNVRPDVFEDLVIDLGRRGEKAPLDCFGPKQIGHPFGHLPD